MQSNDKSINTEANSKWSSKRNNKSNDNSVEMKPKINFDFNINYNNIDNNSSKTSPNKSVNSNKNTDKKSSNNSNKRTKGPLVSQLHSQIKARLNLNASAAKSMTSSSIRPSHVFANQYSAGTMNAHIHSGAGIHTPEQVAIAANCPARANGCRHKGQECCEQGIHHSFISDVTDVRQMENTLLGLLDDFHSGRLQAFGQDITFEKMESVREQQERLARLHFELNLQQEVYGHQTEEGKRLAKDNMTKLIENLQQLSNSIEQLQSRSSVANTGA